ncbi:MAG: ABC transporter substrate-binding protein [Pirellulales bacterium]
MGLGLRFNIRNDIPWQPGDVILSASDVSRHLLAMADARSSAFVPLWADLFENVRTTSAKSLTVQLTRGYVRPQAVLRVPVLPWNLMLPDGDDAPSLGGYRPLEPADDGTHFVARPGYFAAEDGQPDEINERIFSSTTAAVAALRDGEIAAVDRVAPWEIENLRKHDELLVTPYVVPTIHCLIPGRASELAQSRVFRRAILYGIDRQEILDNWLLRGASIPGCRVITGPFPTGYAYDDEVEPRGFKPQLGMTLLWSAWRASVAANEKTDGGGEGDAESNTTETESVSFPELTLAHPNNEIATRASQQIRNYLRALGVPIRLVPFDPATQWDLDAYDLIYAELFVSEPLVDVSTLFGPGGLIEGNGAFLDQYVRSVELATDSRAARNDLLAIHRRVYEDLPIIPLWQLTEHFAVDRRLEGVGAPAVSLYDTVEQWRVPPWQMEGTP